MDFLKIRYLQITRTATCLLTFELRRIRELGVAIIESPDVVGPKVFETSNCELAETCIGVSVETGEFQYTTTDDGETRARCNQGMVRQMLFCEGSTMDGA